MTALLKYPRISFSEINAWHLKNAQQYGPMNQKSKYCGKKIQITGPSGKTATAVINDACPGCKKSKSWT
jgi:hypothetical protein